MHSLVNDLRRAARALLRRGSIAFTVVTILTVALGIGATSAVFTIVKAALIDALPFRDPDRLVFLRGSQERDGTRENWPLGFQDIEELGRRSRAFGDVAGVSGERPFNLSADGSVEHVSGEMATPGYFRVLGIGTVVGRTFTDDEGAPATAQRVVVLSEDFWRGRFGADVAIVGRVIELNDQPYRVIGVAAPGFRGTSGEAQLWLPLGIAGQLYGAHYVEMRQFRWLSAIARMRPASTPETIRADLARMSRDLEATFPVENKGLRFEFDRFRDAYYGTLRTPLLALLAGSALVLLIACTNVANLLLARVVARRREIAVRAALGASRWTLVRQQLAESLVVVGAGAGLGVALAVVCVRLLLAGGLLSLGSYADPRMDLGVTAVAVGAALLSAVLFSTAPILFAARVAPVEGLAEGGRSGGGSGSRRRSRLHWTLVVGEVALSMTLLAGAGLVTKGFRHLLETRLGFTPDRLLTMRLDLTGDRFAKNEPVWLLADDALRRLRALPGITGVALEGPGLPTSGWYATHFVRDDDASPSPTEYMVRRHHVSAGYFATMAIDVRQGRPIGTEDVSGAERAIVVSESFAKQLWPDGSAIGRRIRGVGAGSIPFTVVGVAADVQHGGRDPETLRAPDIYVSLMQSPPRSPSVVNVIVRTPLPAERVLGGIKGALAAAAPGIPPYDVQTMAERLHAQTTGARLLVFLMSSFALLALALAVVGLYGVLVYLVTQRTRELGIRAALGASTRQLVWGVVGQGLRPVAVGVAIGIATSLAVSRAMTSMLYGVSPNDPATLVGTALLLLAAGTAACLVPALRVRRVDPQVTLRAD
jgi:putative ABC transport system permease protein